VTQSITIPHVVEILSNYPAQTFIMRHLEALRSIQSLRVSLVSKAPESYNSATIQPIQQHPFPVSYLPDSRQSLLHQVYHAVRALPYYAPNHSLLDLKAKAIMQSLAMLSPDLIHFQFGHLAAMLASYVQVLGIPYTVSLRGSDIQTHPLTDSDYAKRLCQALEYAAGIHTVADALGDLARNRCQQSFNTTTIRTCLPPTPYKTFPKPNRLHFISVGRLHWNKGFDDLIRAMKYIPNAWLDIVGSGPDEEYLLYIIHMNGLQDRVQLLGNLPYDQFINQLCRATAYVQTSIREGFSNAVAEAMQVGQAIFATPVDGTPELIQDGINGILIPVGEPHSMAEKLILARDTKLMMMLGKAAQATANEHFGMRDHALEFEQFFQQAMNESP